MKKIDLVLIRSRGRDDGSRAMPFGIMDITSYLGKSGFRVKIIDRLKDRISFSETLKRIRGWNPRYVGISAMTSQSEDALMLGSRIKKYLKIPLVYGGLHFTALPGEGLKYGDIVVKGEGENALLDILADSSGVKGIYASRPVLDLDSIPLPQKNLIKELNWDREYFSFLTSRGCPYDCLFCLSKEHKAPVRRHSVEYVLDYIELAKGALGIRKMNILDDIFPLDTKWVFDFCEGIEKRGLNIRLSSFTHSGINNVEMYRAMKRAGFYNVTIGVESGNESVLKAVRKRQTVSGVKETVEIVKKAGLNVSVMFIVGNITETEDSLKDSVGLAGELSLNGWASFAQPYPGSPFREVAEKYGVLKDKNAGNYFNDKISFIPHGLTYRGMKKARNKLLKTLTTERMKPDEAWEGIWASEGAEEDFLRWLEREPESSRLKGIEDYIKARHGGIKGLNTIELGSGMGVYSFIFGQRGANPTLLDKSPRALNRAERLFKRQGIKARFLLKDAFNPGEELRGKFDIAMSFGFAEHFKHPERYNVMKVHYELLKPGGILIVSVPNVLFLPHEFMKAVLRSRKKWSLGYERSFSIPELKKTGEALRLKDCKIIGSSFAGDLKRYFGLYRYSSIGKRLFGAKRREISHRHYPEKKGIFDDFFGADIVLLGAKNDDRVRGA